MSFGEFEPNIFDNFVAKWVLLPLAIVIIIWLFGRFVIGNNKCSDLCEKNGYDDSIAEMPVVRPWTCTCIKEDKDKKYFLHIDMKSGKLGVLRKLDKKE